MAALFTLGRILASPDALEIPASTETDALTLLSRHVSGDWGEIPAEDARENELSVRRGFRVVSCYRVGTRRVWVITEADRRATTLLLPEEY